MRFFRRNRRGANALEFALTLPIFITITFGMMEFGYFFSRKALVNSIIGKACREAAIVDTRAPPPTVSCGGGGDDCVEQMALDTMNNLMANAGMGCSSCTANVVGSASNVPPDKRVTCRIDTPHQDITGFYTAFFPTNLEAETTVRLEWQRASF